MPTPFESSSSATSDPNPPSRGRTLGPAVTVLFSGGSDSTLTASLMTEEYERVHLITYKHRTMRFEEKCLASLERLARAHGADRFVHSFIDINPVMDRMFYRPLGGDLKEYGTYALPMCCGACKLSMHVRTIQYNQEHGIPRAVDGSNVELSELFPEQMPAVLAQYRRLYRRFGVEYDNPVFDVGRSDHRLFERGVTEQRDYKSQHVVYSNQHSCVAGVLLYGYTLAVGLPLLQRSSNAELAERYIAAKIDGVCIPYLESLEANRTTAAGHDGLPSATGEVR